MRRAAANTCAECALVLVFATCCSAACVHAQVAAWWQDAAFLDSGVQVYPVWVHTCHGLHRVDARWLAVVVVDTWCQQEAPFVDEYTHHACRPAAVGVCAAVPLAVGALTKSGC